MRGPDPGVGRRGRAALSVVSRLVRRRRCGSTVISPARKWRPPVLHRPRSMQPTLTGATVPAATSTLQATIRFCRQPTRVSPSSTSTSLAPRFLASTRSTTPLPCSVNSSSPWAIASGSSTSRGPTLSVVSGTRVSSPIVQGLPGSSPSSQPRRLVPESSRRWANMCSAAHAFPLIVSSPFCPEPSCASEPPPPRP